MNPPSLTIENFAIPFGGKLNAENRWMKIAEVMPWDVIEDIQQKFWNNT